MTCVGGVPTCHQTTQPTAPGCDFMDNDCNGIPDQPDCSVCPATYTSFVGGSYVTPPDCSGLVGTHGLGTTINTRGQCIYQITAVDLQPLTSCEWVCVGHWTLERCQVGNCVGDLLYQTLQSSSKYPTPPPCAPTTGLYGQAVLDAQVTHNSSGYDVYTCVSSQRCGSWCSGPSLECEYVLDPGVGDCGNGIQDGQETGVDCGGPCAPCPVGGASAPPCKAGSPNPCGCGGVNVFDAYTGNAHREIVDLELWGGVGEHRLAWIRYNNTRVTPGVQHFGQGGNWRHGYQWDMTASGQNASGQAQVTLAYPDGTVNLFTQTSPTRWTSTPAITDVLVQTGTTLALQTRDGWRYAFAQLLDANMQPFYQLQTITDSQQNVYTLTYDTSGRLVLVTEPAGRYLQVAYTMLGASPGVEVVDHVTTSDARTVAYTYQRVADPPPSTGSYEVLSGTAYGDGSSATYTYTQLEAGTRPLVSQAIDPRTRSAGVNIKYQYDANVSTLGKITQELDGVTGMPIASLVAANGNKQAPAVSYPNGSAVQYQIDSNGNITTRRDELGRTTSFSYDQAGRVTSAVDPLYRTESYTYSPGGNYLKVVHTDLSAESWARDDLDLVLTHTDELGHTVTFTRDAQHRVVGVHYPDGSAEAFAYNAFGEVLTHTLPNGGVEIFNYDTSGHMVSSIDPMGQATVYTYDAADRLASVTDPNSHTTSFAYDERGQRVSVTNPDGTTVGFAYDVFGNKIRETNELGNARTYVYDELRRLTSETDPLARTVRYGYANGASCASCNAQGKPTSITLPSGKQTALAYDQAWQLISRTVGVATPDAATASYKHDLVGNVITVVDPRGQTSTLGYDQRDRPASSTDPLGNKTSRTYDAAGNKVTETRADGGVTSYAHDVMNRVVKVTDPLHRVTTLGYDLSGNLTKLTDAKGNVYTFVYDLMRRPTATVYPDGSTESYVYDAVGNVVRHTTRAGQTKACTYDSRNRPLVCTWSDGTPGTATTYDPAGRIVSLVSSVSALAYAYDAANEVLSETQTVTGDPGGPRTLAYAYDADGNRASLGYPDGTVVRYGYTGRNQLATVSTGGPLPVASYTYDAAGNRLKRTYDNGTATVYAYDAANRLSSVAHQRAAVTFQSFAYGYNSVGNRVWAKHEDGKGDVFSHDGFDQLVGAQYGASNVDTTPSNPQRVVGYVYDALGNRSSMTDNGVPTAYATNNLNQYTHVGTTGIGYDADGNLSAQAGWSYTYDAENRLVAASNGSTTATFAYDGLGRRVSQTIGGSAAFSYYDGWNLVEDRDGSGVEQERYVRGARVDEILRRTMAGAAVYYDQDALGSVASLTDSSGAEIESYKYDAYGRASIFDSGGNAIAASAVANRHLFTGREYIQALGVYDYRTRVYSADLGRFLQKDSIGFAGGDPNLYAYVGNAPVILRDPLGAYPLGDGFDAQALSWLEYVDESMKHYPSADPVYETWQWFHAQRSLSDCGAAQEDLARADHYAYGRYLARESRWTKLVAAQLGLPQQVLLAALVVGYSASKELGIKIRTGPYDPTTTVSSE